MCILIYTFIATYANIHVHMPMIENVLIYNNTASVKLVWKTLLLKKFSYSNSHKDTIIYIHK